MPFDAATLPPAEVSETAIDILRRRGLLQTGDWIILTKGDFYSDSGGTNGMKILRVG